MKKITIHYIDDCGEYRSYWESIVKNDYDLLNDIGSVIYRNDMPEDYTITINTIPNE